MAKYFVNILISLDQLLTSLLGGWPDETLSSYAYRLEAQNKFFGRIFRPLIDAIFFWQDNHCEQALIEERLRLQTPPELR